VIELFGTKEEYYHTMANAFYVNPSDQEIWPNKETLDLEGFSWIKEGDRGVRKNVWEILKTFMKKLSDAKDIINNEKQKYLPVTLNHMLFFMLLIRMRKRMVFFEL